MSIYRFRRAAWAVPLLAVGCQPTDVIQSYTVPKEAAVLAMQAAAVEPSDRMITAILPDGDRAWFLKVVGPLAEIDRRAEDVTKFFETVRVAPGKPHPDWQLLDGWKQLESTGMRAATISIPSEDKPLEMAVTTLPWTGRQDDLLSNVNRWRGQMQLPPIGVIALADCTRELTAGDATMTIVDLRGTMGSTGMTPPFAGGGPMQPGSSPRTTGEPASAGGGFLPAGHPPIAGASPAGSDSAAPMTFDTPDSWQSLPPTGFRKAAFEIASGDAAANVTVTSFATSAPAITDVLSNLNRWRSELGLAQVGDQALADATETVELDGVAGTLVNVIPDPSKPAESRADKGTLAAMVVRGETVWFFKLMGDRDLVAAERDNFRAFLKSVRFTAGGGADDGD